MVPVKPAIISGKLSSPWSCNSRFMRITAISYDVKKVLYTWQINTGACNKCSFSLLLVSLMSSCSSQSQASVLVVILLLVDWNLWKLTLPSQFKIIFLFSDIILFYNGILYRSPSTHGWKGVLSSGQVSLVFWLDHLFQIDSSIIWVLL